MIGAPTNFVHSAHMGTTETSQVIYYPLLIHVLFFVGLTNDNGIVVKIELINNWAPVDSPEIMFKYSVFMYLCLCVRVRACV